jgi:hypothetical protein
MTILYPLKKMVIVAITEVSNAVLTKVLIVKRSLKRRNDPQKGCKNSMLCTVNV